MISVMIVDDQVGIRHALQKVLRAEGYDVRLARDGRSAVEKQRSFPASVITLDMKMEPIDGIEVATRIRQFDRSVAIVPVSAFAREYGPRAKGLDLFEWVNKPVASEFSKRMFLDVIRRAQDHVVRCGIPEELSALGYLAAEPGESEPPLPSLHGMELVREVGEQLSGSPETGRLLLASLLLEIEGVGEAVAALQRVRIAALSHDYQKDLQALSGIANSLSEEPDDEAPA